MILAQVIGPVVSTMKINQLDGYKLLRVRAVNPDGSFSGPSIVAVDTVQAGKGDTVVVIDEGGSAGVMLEVTGQPIRTVIAGIVDRIDTEERVQ